VDRRLGHEDEVGANNAPKPAKIGSMQRYKIVEGKVQTRSLEYHVADHCNLRCDHCCSYSPLLKKWFAEPEIVERDLRAASRGVAPTYLKIVGGEPLLHPELERLLCVAKSLEIAPILQLTTNGLLIERLTPRAWDSLDILTVSLYPEPRLPKSLIRFIAREAATHNVRVNWKTQDKFNCMDRAESAGYDETKTVFERCWLRYRCNCVKDGRFYCCTRPQYVRRMAVDPDSFLEDGVDVLTPDGLAERIKEYLERSEPLQSCFLCQGGDAPLETNRQLTAIEVRRKRESLTNIVSSVGAALRC
jgi:organic radical activating enzyme